MTTKINELRVTNIVATFYVGESINISAISISHPFLIEISNTFASGVIRFAYPKTTCLLFPPGRVVVLGAKFKENAKLAAWKCCMVLRKCGLENASVNMFKIVNMTFSVNIGGMLDIVEFYERNKASVQYNPQNFPAATLKSFISSLTLNVFESGQIIVTGAKNTKSGLNAYRSAKPGISRFIVHDAEKIKTMKKKTKKVRKTGL